MFAIVFFSLLSFGSQKIPWGFTGSKIVGGGGSVQKTWAGCAASFLREGPVSTLLSLMPELLHSDPGTAGGALLLLSGDLG